MHRLTSDRPEPTTAEDPAGFFVALSWCVLAGGAGWALLIVLADRVI